MCSDVRCIDDVICPQMVITFDDQFLLTVSEDGCLLIWKIIDKEGRGLKREKELVYAEEILITKLDLEEKVTFVFVPVVFASSDLDARVLYGCSM